jgi:hypothetical protein
VTATCPPIATLASVLVRDNTGVEGRNQKSVSGESRKWRNTSRVVSSLRRRVSRSNVLSNAIEGAGV